MSQKCCALFCKVDDSAGLFKLFQFPSNAILRKEWQVRSGVSADVGENFGGNSNLYLCEVGVIWSLHYCFVVHMEDYYI